ncbi:MAG: DUF5343 domain-containing protein [Nitrospirota bacterium]|nr:DUF5343 domain-containing protein [Nitrospirota bacterium]
MAEEKKKGFPKIANSNWFGLREKLKQRVPAKLSLSYVASALGMTEASARANVVTPLRAFGLIGEDGKPTELAYDWRDDSKYGTVCDELIGNIYPQELRDLFHEPTAPLEDITVWFMRQGKVGQAAAKMHAGTYLMLLQKDPALAKEPTKIGTKPNRKKQSAASKEKKKPAATVNKAQNDNAEEKEGDTIPFGPSLHIDVQVHISPESTPEQIDKIFEAMAKHLKGFRG